MTKLTGIFKFFLLPVLTVFAVLQLSAANDELKNLSEDDFKYLRGDSWQVVGNNVILTGRVHLPLGNTEIFADKAIINLGSRDFEAVGNVRVFCWTDISGAYPAMAQAFVRLFPEIDTVNREDDGGDAGLRYSKLQYKPKKLLEKYLVKID